jgi:hypothetical protein
MPPEQIAGQIDATSDLYAAGATALHLLTGRAPSELMDGPELRVPQLAVRPALRRFLQRLVHPRPAKRFASASQAMVALKKASTDPGRRHLRLIGVAAVGLVVALIARGLPGAKPAASVQPAASHSSALITSECCAALRSYAEKERATFPPELQASLEGQPTEVWSHYGRAGSECDQLKDQKSPQAVVEKIRLMLEPREMPPACVELRNRPQDK